MDRRDFLRVTTTVATISALPTVARADNATSGSDIRSVLHFERRNGVFDGIAMGTTPVVRGDSKTIFYVSDDRMNILSARAPRIVTVPFADYTKIPDYAVEERIIAMFDCADICAMPEEYTTPMVSYADAVSTLAAKVHGDFGSILVNERDADRILPHAEGRRVIVSKFIPVQVVYATASPAQTGGIFEDPQGRLAMFIRVPSVARVFVK